MCCGLLPDDGRAPGPIDLLSNERCGTKPDDSAPRGSGYYSVAAVDPTSRDNTYDFFILERHRRDFTSYATR